MRLLAFVLLLLACGVPRPPPATHADFRAIQRQEAVLDNERNDALGECAVACIATERGGAATARICDIAGGVNDHDASLRCRAATDRCEQYRAATSRCGCSELEDADPQRK